MKHVTILGQHISLIRPLRVVKYTAQGAWKVLGESRRTIKLSIKQKKQIAAQMGYRLTEG